jgi:anti-sigma-K factor RskA
MSAAPDREGPEALDALAAEYVLGTQSAERRAATRERLSGDGALRAAVDAWERRLAPLAALAEPVAPSPSTWRRIDASIDASAPRAAARAPGGGWWGELRVWRGLAAAGFAAALLLATALALRGPAPPRYVVVLVAPQDESPGWIVRARRGGELELEPLGRTEVPEGRSLQFWTKGEDWPGPVSLGLVRPGEPRRVAIDRLPPLRANQLFEITLEPYDGSPTGRPTGPILYIGRAVPTM